jgi:cytochrome P450
MLNDYWAPSLDTTIMAIGSAVRLFAEHPGQWDLVRADPRLISHAINEVLRLESPIQMFSRLLTDDYQLDGVTLPAGERVVVVFASANRDERKWDDPDRFDVRRRPSDHVAFGWGQLSGPAPAGHGPRTPGRHTRRPGSGAPCPAWRTTPTRNS